MRSPAPCLRPADCEDPARECLPWLDPDSGEVSPACLFGAAGERAAGEHCSSDDECVTGICTPDDICLQVCEEDGECGEGRLCGTVDVRVGEVDGEVPACVPDPGSGDPCTRDAGCPDGEACRPEPGPGEDEVVLVCRPVLGEGAPTDRCELPWDCRSGHCMPSASDPRIRSCFGACTEEADCGGLPCEDQPVGLPEREEVAVAACLDPHQPCTRDAGCPLEGWVCTPAADPDDAGVLAPVCDEPAGEGAGGAECEADEDCRSGLCLVDLETPVCWQACEADEDCPEGTRCYEDLVSVPVEGGSSTVPACAPDRGTLTPCTNDAACGDDEVCSAMPDGVRETLRTRCVLPADPPPEECQNLERGDCLSGVCFEPNPQIPVPVCLELCEAEADCPVVLVVVQVPCQPKTVTVDGVSSVVLACSLL